MLEDFKIQITSSGVLVRDRNGSVIQEFPTEEEAREFLKELLMSEE